MVAGPPSTVDSRVGTASVVSDEPICRLPFSAFLHPGPTGVVSTSGRAVVCREVDAKRRRRNPDDPPVGRRLLVSGDS